MGPDSTRMTAASAVEAVVSAPAITPDLAATAVNTAPSPVRLALVVTAVAPTVARANLVMPSCAVKAIAEAAMAENIPEIKDKAL